MKFNAGDAVTLDGSDGSQQIILHFGGSAVSGIHQVILNISVSADVTLWNFEDIQATNLFVNCTAAGTKTITWLQQGPDLVGSNAIGAPFQGSSVALSADG